MSLLPSSTETLVLGPQGMLEAVSTAGENFTYSITAVTELSPRVFPFFLESEGGQKQEYIHTMREAACDM